MSTSNQQKNKFNPWKTIYYAFPSVLIFRSSEFFIKNDFIEILFSGILAFLGTLLGAISYRIVETKSTYLKIVGFAILTSICILYLFFARTYGTLLK